MYEVCIIIVALSIIGLFIIEPQLFTEKQSDSFPRNFGLFALFALIEGVALIGICSNETWEREAKLKTIEQYNNGEIRIDTISSVPRIQVNEKQIIKVE